MKMKYKALRQYMKDKHLSSPHVLKNCDLVIDGNSFFKNTYKFSGLQFIVGPDCDSYANFLKRIIQSYFLDNDIECYVIFSSGTRHELGKREEIHQKCLEGQNEIVQDLKYTKYFQPLFVDDVQKQVLDEMDIKYFVCEYDAVEAIVGVARNFKCPVLTNHIEYSLFRVSCIPFNLLKYDINTKPLQYHIYEHETVRSTFGVYDKMPILLTLLNENEDYVGKLNEIFEYKQHNVITSVVRWVKRQRKEVLVSTVLKSIDYEDQEAFNELYKKIETLYLYPLHNLAVKYFQRDKPYSIFKDDKKWFAKGVSNGTIAPPYINLKKEAVICGSLILNNSEQPDALLAAIDIIVHAHCLLTNSQDSTITFIGAKCNNAKIWKIATNWGEEISNRDIFTKRCKGIKIKSISTGLDPYTTFLKEVLPGFDYNKHLETIPVDCRILIITLVYYVYNKNGDFVHGAYCVLLSYIMLRFKQSSEKFFNGLKFLFNKIDLEIENVSTIVHSFSEFQHCLQHMNYLNKLCGEKIPCTIYENTYNATFVYNSFLFMRDKDGLFNFLENNFEESPILKRYKNIITCFDNCLSIVKVSGNNKKISIKQSIQPIADDD